MLRSPRPRLSDGGFTLLELVGSLAALLVAIMGLAGVLVSVQRQREQMDARDAVVRSVSSLLEEVRSTSPDAIVATFDGNTRFVYGIEGSFDAGAVIRVTVDSTDPDLLQLAIDAAWAAGGSASTFDIETVVYLPTA